jgi:pimeloyl-ACP methyl ester carboxylesterase
MRSDEVERPLARFRGESPPQPGWYRELALEPAETPNVVVDGASIEVLVWGEAGKPGIVLAHGSLAHARWWGPVAPLLARDYRVVSFSWSGMGGSQWRPAYSIDQQVDELFAAAEAGGVLSGRQPPVVAAHSFGSRALTKAAAERGDELAGAIIVDGVILPGRWPRATGMRARLPYSDLAQALARFKLAPAQPCEHPCILDYIARAGLEEKAGGWRWRFDPEFFGNYAYSDVWPALARPRCPLAIVYGEQSLVLTPEGLAQQKAQAPAGTAFVRIPQAGHHIMVDQPIALAVALHSLVETWLPRVTRKGR